MRTECQMSREPVGMALNREGYYLDQNRGIWCRPVAGSFTYGDGEEVEARLISAVGDVQDRSVDSAEWRDISLIGLLNIILADCAATC